MLANTVKLRGRPGEGIHGKTFIEEVRVKEQRPAAGFDRVLVLFWGLMLSKCLFSTWAVGYWDMPVSSFWVWLPSLVFGTVCTVLYRYRE